MVGPRRAARKEGRGRLRAVKRFGVSFLDVGRGGKEVLYLFDHGFIIGTF